jgi:hypothetical protein
MPLPPSATPTVIKDSRFPSQRSRPYLPTSPCPHLPPSSPTSSRARPHPRSSRPRLLWKPRIIFHQGLYTTRRAPSRHASPRLRILRHPIPCPARVPRPPLNSGTRTPSPLPTAPPEIIAVPIYASGPRSPRPPPSSPTANHDGYAPIHAPHTSFPIAPTQEGQRPSSFQSLPLLRSQRDRPSMEQGQGIHRVGQKLVQRRCGARRV